MSVEKRFNLIGFNFQSDNSNIKGYDDFKHCLIHPGKRLLKSLEDPEKLFCPTCGLSFSEKDTLKDEHFNPKFGAASNKPKILTGKRKRVKYYDTRGNEIPEHDADAIHDMAEGRKILHYHEEKVEKEEKKVIRKIK